MDTPLFDGELVHARRMIYTPSAFAKSNLVHLQEVGQLQARSPHASTRQGLASYLFFVVESGSGTLEYEGETRVLSAGDCVFLDCRRPYRHYTGDDLWQLRWAHFYGPNMAANPPVLLHGGRGQEQQHRRARRIGALPKGGPKARRPAPHGRTGSCRACH